MSAGSGRIIRTIIAQETVSYTHLTETEDSIQERLATARQELAQQDKFTLKLVNDQVDTLSLIHI